MNDLETKQSIVKSLQAFASKPVAEAALALFESLGYRSQKRLALKPNTAATFTAQFAKDKPLNPETALLTDWQSVDFLFQLTDDEVRAAAGGNQPLLFESKGKYNGAAMESYLFLAIALKKPQYTRTELSGITRAVNRLFPMPVMLLFRHGDTLTLAVINRRLHKLDSAKDVLEKVTLIKDIRFASPHRAHIEILADLSFDSLRERHDFSNFVTLHAAWQKSLDSSELNKRFFLEVANWYFWALSHVEFPKNAPKQDGEDHISVIRLITRLMFVWFIKEKGLVPDLLFDERKLPEILSGFSPTKTGDKESVFYRAILQNLFFATLNTEMDKRGWTKEEQNFMAHSLYRFRELFRKPADALDLFKNIPFLNGGLFECLDKDKGENAKPRYIRIDGFSRREDSQAVVPDFLFFGPEREVDLSEKYGDKKFKNVKVRGLIHTFQYYKFTITENTPIEEEIALDPELSGKVFENLLAAYNPETGATARKQTGSFFTPREIVNYMVDEALIAYLKTKLEAAHPSAKDVEARLRHLFAYNAEKHQFTPQEVETLIAAIDNLKSIDPAVGSGALPMGILHKLVFILGKLDPRNEKWKERQVGRVRDAMAAAEKIEDATVQEKTLRELEQQIAGINEAFEHNELDYGRKLYLIENCIYGVDIQPIAVQIAKMRFFISLIADQKIDDAKPNRGVRPLPNLETKFVAANTLIAVNRPGQQMLRNRVIEAKEADLRRVRERHFMARTPVSKAKCRDQDAKLRAEIAELLKGDGWDSATARKLASWDPYDQNASAGFFDAEWMFGVLEGFDICEANPPYVLLQAGNRDEAMNEYFRAHFKVASYKLDLYHLFIERGVNLLKPGGTVAYITPSNFASNNYTVPLRRFLLTETTLEKLVFFDDGVFDASVHNLVFVAHNSKLSGAQTSFCKAAVSEFGLELEQKSRVKQADLVDDMCLLVPRSGAGAEAILRKMAQAGDTFGSAASINFGMQLRDRSEYPQDVIESPLKSALTKFHRECYAGKDVHRFYVSFTDRYCYFNRCAKRGGCWDEEMHNAKGKILVRQIGDYPEGGLDTRGYAVLNAAFMIYPKSKSLDSRFLLGLLNSSAIRFYWLNKFRDDRKTFPKIKGEYLKLLPMPKADSAKQASITRLVEKVVSSKHKNATTQTTSLEREIDQQVYALYGLTPEEIKVVEDATK